MKKLKVLGLIAFICLIFAACGEKEVPSIIGAWRTDNVGYYTITTFNEDGTYSSVFKITDEEKSALHGLSQDILDAMSHTNYYKQVQINTLSSEEKEMATGDFAIKVYSNKEEMEADINYALSFYTVEDDILNMDGCIYNKCE